jgi:phasin family protein
MVERTGNPFLDFDPAKAMAEAVANAAKLEALFTAQRRTAEALSEANAVALDGFRTLVQRQLAITGQAFGRAEKTALELASTAPEELAAKQMDAAHAAYEQALADAEELSRIAAKTGTDAAEVLNKRIVAGFRELKDLVSPRREGSAD